MTGNHIRANAVRTMARRFAALASRPDDQTRPMTNTPSWTVNDTLGHVAMEPSRYRELALGGGDWPARAADLPAFNAAQIRALPTRDPGALAATLVSDTDSLIDTVAAFGDEPPLMNFDGNQRVVADRALGTLLGEFTVHGFDLARVSDQPWPIDADHVPLVLDGLHQVMPGWVDPSHTAGHTAVYELTLRGLGIKHRYVFTDGALTVDPQDHKPVDLHLRAEPVAWLLLSYGRGSQVRASLTGALFAWGRRPWLATGFARRFLPA